MNKEAFTKDRMLIIFRNSNSSKQLLFNNMGLPGFMLSPACFTLIINNFGFVNISYDLLLSKSFGLPYPKEQYLYYHQYVERLTQGTLKISYPVIDFNYSELCSQIYQPILVEEYKNIIQSLIKSDYYRKIFINKDSIIGKIFFSNLDKKIKLYPNTKQKDWIPRNVFNVSNSSFIRSLLVLTLKIHNLLLKPLLNEKAPILKEIVRDDVSNAIELNNIIIKNTIQNKYKL